MAPSLIKHGNKYRFRLPSDGTGKKRWRVLESWEYDGTESDAKRVMLSILGTRPEHRLTPDKIKFLPFAEGVISKLQMEKKTRSNYLRDLEKMRSLHDIEVCALRYEDIANLISELQTMRKPKGVRGEGVEGYSTNTIRNVRIPLNLICEEALRQGKLTINPVPLGRWPACDDTEEVRILRAEELPVLLQAAIDYHRYGKVKYAAIFALALFAGLRKGEIARLAWSDIDFEGMAIHVRKEGRVRRVKTKNAVRRVEMSQLLCDILWTHRLELETASKLDLVFPTVYGNPMNDTNLQKIVTGILLRSGIWQPENTDKPELQLKPTLHKLRHNYGSVLLASGVDLKFTSNQIGHSNGAFTLKTYTHVVPELSKGTAAAAIDAWAGSHLGPTEGNSGEFEGQDADS